MTTPLPMRLLLCSTCAGTPDRAADRSSIETALDQLGLRDQVELIDHPCLSACAKPVSIGLQGVGRASYVFSGVSPETDAADIAATCQIYLNSPKGWIEDARPCGRLRLCLRARLPAL